MPGVLDSDTCLDPDDVAALLHHRLAPASLRAVEQHVAVCIDCRKLLSALAQSEAPATAPPLASGPTDEIAFAATLSRYEPPPNLSPGARIGRYIVASQLGAGAMGVVYAAHDPELDRKVALKVLHDGGLVGSDREFVRDRLLREAQAMARLAHPNVVTVHDAGTIDGQIFIAMELVDGQTLADWLSAAPRSWRAVISMFLPAGEGLAAAHAAGLLHRDFKPENVLVGSDGRVRVGDFGLARRFALDDPDSSDQRSMSNLRAVEATTTTSVLVGTPYYMAPEQFLCQASELRSDLFSFCVALYAAIARHHPFDGEDIVGLAEAVMEGRLRPPPGRSVLPRQLLRVLRRGLSIKPEERYPSMDVLLAELRTAVARAADGRRRSARVVAVGVGMLAMAGLAVALVASSTAVDSSVCESSPEAEMADAWSPALRASLTQHFAGSPDLSYPVDELDGFAARWISDYRSACTSPHGTRTFARLACLLGERDEVARFAELLPTLPQSALPEIEMTGVLPRLQACDGESPVAPPTLPADPVKRGTIRELRAKLLRTRFAPIDEVLAEMPGVLAEAEEVGWDPIIAEAHQGFGIAADRAGMRWELAHDHYKRASQLALRSHHYHLESNLWIARLFSEVQVASEPADRDDFAHLVEQARDAAHNAGDDPVDLAHIKWVESVPWGATQFDALASARIMALSGRSFLTAMMIATDAANTLAMRNRPGDLDAAWEMLVDTQRAAPAGRLSETKLRRLMSRFRLIALLRGDLTAAHLWDDREGAPKPADGAVAIRGRVVDMRGNAVVGATVVAWSGILEGDATRAYRRAPRALPDVDVRNTPPGYQQAGFEADVATTGLDGGFTVRAVRDGGIIAELGGRRSQPRAIGDGAIVLQLEPTRAIEGRVASQEEVLSEIVITAHYQLGRTLAWDCTAAVGRLHDYHLAGLPAGRATLRLDTWFVRPRKLEFGPVRDGAELQWPAGPSLDVIVRGAPSVTHWVYVLRGHLTAKTTADLDRLVDGAAEATVNPAFVIGVGDRTAEGMRHYQRGDHHRVILGNPPGEVTVCVAEAEPTSPAICQTIEIPTTTPEVLDGHGIYPAIPVLFQR